MSTVLSTCIGIFWDYENCRPPSNISGAKLVENIRRLFRGAGPITQFKAYVDVSSEVAQPRSIAFHSDLQSSGVTLAHCPHNGKKDVADKMMIADMLAFALDRPVPAKVVIITGDRDFAYASAILRLRGYETVIISPPNTGYASLKMQTDQIFDWQKDVINVTCPDTTFIDTASQATGIIATEDERPKVNRTAETRPPVRVSETGTCLRQPVLDNAVESSAATNRNTSVDEKPSSKETIVTLEKPLFTVPSGVLISDKVPSLKSGGLVSPGQPAASSAELAEVPNKPGCILLNPFKAQAAGLGMVAASYCSCTTCIQSSRVKQESSEVGFMPTFKQPAPLEEHYKSCNQVDDTVDSSTSTPTSASTVTSSSNTTASITTSPINEDSFTTPSPASVLRFWPLIEYFIDRRTLTGLTRVRSSTVASELRKHNPKVYENARVTKMKQYIEEARKANVVISLELDKEGDGWIEINPRLYWVDKPNSADKGWQLNPLPRNFRPAVSPESFKMFGPVVDAIFEPLVTRLRMEAPDYVLLHTRLRTYFKTEYPSLFKTAGVNNLSQYLQKAEDQGVICLKGPAGGQWVKLTKKYRRFGDL